MNENPDKGMKGCMGEIANALRNIRKDENTRRPKAPLDFKAQRKTLILGGAGILLLLIILITLFSTGGSEISTEYLASIQARFNQLEERLTRLEGMEDKIVFLGKQDKELRQYVAETERSGRSLTKRLDKLTQKLDQLKKTTASAPAKTETPLTIQREPFSLDKGRYHEVRSGDSLYWIAQQYGTSVDKLCRLNDMTPNQVIYPGQKLLIAPEDNQ